MASQQDLDALVGSLRVANMPVEKKAAIDALYGFYANSDRPSSLRKRALGLAKKASQDMIKEGIEEYEQVAHVIVSARDTIENATSLAVSGEENLILPKAAAHMENVLAVLKEVKVSVDAIAGVEHNVDEEDIDGAAKAANKLATEASAIRDKLTAMGS